MIILNRNNIIQESCSNPNNDNNCIGLYMHELSIATMRKMY